jgi:integrase
MASIQTRHGKRGKAYRVQYRDQVGHQAVRTFKTLADARAYKARVETNRPDDVIAGRVNLDQVLQDMRSQTSWSAATLRQQDVFRSALERVDPDLFKVDVGKLTVPRANQAVQGIAAPSMRKRSRVFLNQLLKHAGRAAIPGSTTKTRADRMDRDRMRSKERPLETSEVEAILNHIDPRYRTMITLMAYVGLRPGEAYGLQVQDFDPESNTLKVQRAVSRGKVGPTKTGENRTLPIGGLGDLLRGHIGEPSAATAALESHIFTNGQGRIIHENTFGPVFKRAVKAAGIPNQVSPNSLRHHAAAWMIGRGANVLQVSKMLGHARPSITLDVYSYLFQDSLDAVAKLLPSGTQGQPPPPRALESI